MDYWENKDKQDPRVPRVGLEQTRFQLCTANKEFPRSYRLFSPVRRDLPSHSYRRRPDRPGREPRLCFDPREYRGHNRSRILNRQRQKFRRHRCRYCDRGNRAEQLSIAKIHSRVPDHSRETSRDGQALRQLPSSLRLPPVAAAR